MENQKDKFQLKTGVSYINCAYMAPLLKSSEEIAIQGLIRKRNPFEITQEDFFKDSLQARSLFANLVHCESDEVALLPSTSYGFASLLNAFKPKGKTECLVVENEFPSGYFATQKWAESHGASLKIIRPRSGSNRNADWNIEIVEAITENTAFVLISSVHWMDGTAFDLMQIGSRCREKGAKLIVDGTQSVGARPMDVKAFQIDALVCACYKWLFGPYGSAIAYIGEGFYDVSPIEESWMNRQNAHRFAELCAYEQNYFPKAAKFNVGEANDFIKTPMLVDCFSQILTWNVENIEKYCENLLQPLCDFMQENGFHLEGNNYQAKHLMGFDLGEKMDAGKLLIKLQEKKIILSVRGNSLRVSPNVYNTKEDIDTLIQVLKSTLFNS